MNKHKCGVSEFRRTVLVGGFAMIFMLVLLAPVAQAQEKKISRAQLPPAVEKTVAREAEGATIKGFASEIENRQKFYEVSLTVEGRNKDILMDKDGNIVEVEEEVSMETLPATIQAALKKAAGGGTIQMIESVSKNGSVVAYEAHIKRGKKRSEIKLGPNGETMN